MPREMPKDMLEKTLGQPIGEVTGGHPTSDALPHTPPPGDENVFGFAGGSTPLRASGLGRNTLGKTVMPIKRARYETDDNGASDTTGITAAKRLRTAHPTKKDGTKARMQKQLYSQGPVEINKKASTQQDELGRLGILCKKATEGQLEFSALVALQKATVAGLVDMVKTQDKIDNEMEQQFEDGSSGFGSDGFDGASRMGPGLPESSSGRTRLSIQDLLDD